MRTVTREFNDMDDAYDLFMEEYDGWVDDCKGIAVQAKEIFEKEIRQ